MNIQITSHPTHQTVKNIQTLMKFCEARYQKVLVSEDILPLQLTLAQVINTVSSDHTVVAVHINKLRNC